MTDWKPRFKSSWCHDEQAAAELNPARRVYLDEENKPQPNAEPPTFTPTERQRWSRFITRMLDGLLPHREAYTLVRKLIDETLAESASP